MTFPCRRLSCFAALLLAACGGGQMGGTTSVTPNLDAVPQAKAGCEAPTQDLLLIGPTMLPGRACAECHQPGGQSSVVFTASGTVFGSATAQCNTGGVAGVKVELLDQNGMPLNPPLVTTTNSSGNFMFTQMLTFPITARITGTDGKVQQMFGGRPTGACATCHQQPPQLGAPGRITLNL